MSGTTTDPPDAMGSAADGHPEASETPEEREAWAILLSVAGLGPAGFAALLAGYGSGRAILEAASQPGAAGRFVRIAGEGDGRRPFGSPVGEGIVAAAAELADRLALLRGSGLTILTLDDAAYPARLRAIELPPPVLLVRGSLDALAGPRTVAVVGTRHPTEQGRLVAARIAGAIARAGAVVVSGLAVGIDGAAHSAVADDGRPTVGVLGSGHLHLFPRAHARLTEKIVDTAGAVVSEFWPDQRPSTNTFPQRNRVISGLSDATVVVEAGERSGALITARWALEQGRDLFMVPGLLGEARSLGNLLWLRELPGEARIVARIAELLADLGLPIAGSPPAEADDAVAAGSRRPGVDAILAELGPTVRLVGEALLGGHGSVDDLAAATDLAPATILGAITLLELHGLATSTYGRYRAAGQLASAELPTRGRSSPARLPVRTGPC